MVDCGNVVDRGKILVSAIKQSVRPLPRLHIRTPLRLAVPCRQPVRLLRSNMDAVKIVAVILEHRLKPLMPARLRPSALRHDYLFRGKHAFHRDQLEYQQPENPCVDRQIISPLLKYPLNPVVGPDNLLAVVYNRYKIGHTYILP